MDEQVTKLPKNVRANALQKSRQAERAVFEALCYFEDHKLKWAAEDAQTALRICRDVTKLLNNTIGVDGGQAETEPT